MEAYMKMKRLGITILLIVIILSSVFAASPSKFDIGILNYYSIQDIADTEFTAYTPGVRLEGHITPWFGLGLDALLEKPFESPSGVYRIIATTDVSFRAPLGFFEPYIALGPTYILQIDSGVELFSNVAYSGRVGFDFNITPIFTVGVEGKLLLDDLSGLIDGSYSIDWLDSTFVGLTLKAKF